MPTDQNWLLDKSVYAEYFAKSSLKDEDLTVENFKPGTSGSAALYNRLRQELGV